MVYIDGKFKTNVTKGSKKYNLTGLIANTSHTIGTRTVDSNGNINQTWVNSTAWTKLDFTAPANITNLTNASYARSFIRWTWTDPKDPDSSKGIVYLDGTWKTNVFQGCAILQCHWTACQYPAYHQHTHAGCKRQY